MRNVSLTLILILGLSAAEAVPVWAQTDEWTRLGSTPEDGIYNLIVDPRDSNTLYATTYIDTGGLGLFKSTNGGASWRALTIGLPTAGSAYLVAIDLQDRGTLYAGAYAEASGRGLFKSTDGGESWGPTGLTDTWIGPLAVDPHIRNTLYVFAGDKSSNGIYRSTDGGTSWVNLGSPRFSPDSAISALAIDPKDSSTLYAADGASGNGLYKSTDGGITWSGTTSPSLQGCFFYNILVSPLATGTLYVVGFCEDLAPAVYKTTDAGATWSAVSPGLQNGSGSLAFAFDPDHPQIMYVGLCDFQSLRMYRSVDAGANWSALNNGLHGLCVVALALGHGTPYASYAVTSDGIFKTSPLLATKATLDPASVRLGSTFTATLSGTNLTDATYFDVLFRSPGNNTEEEVLNWQQGLSATHGVPADTAPGAWTITRLRAHRDIDDHYGTYVLVSATMNLNPVVVTAVTFDPSNVPPAGSFSATFSGTNLTSETYFDVRFRSPGGDTDQFAPNWQKGPTAGHSVPIGAAAGSWTVTGIWAHENAGDHSSDFVPVSAVLVLTEG